MLLFIVAVTIGIIIVVVVGILAHNHSHRKWIITPLYSSKKEIEEKKAEFKRKTNVKRNVYQNQNVMNSASLKHDSQSNINGDISRSNYTESNNKNKE